MDNVQPFSAGVPEWPKGSDCNSDAKASVVRIHPPAPIDVRRTGFGVLRRSASWCDECRL